MQYQLVLQLPASSIKDYDEVVELEEAIMGSLGNLGTVDGHDAGSGEMNIFILTNHPRPAFERIKQILGTRDFMPDLKVAFRMIGKDEFIILHPAGLTYFGIV
jgi:hypothetical protein